MSIEENIRHLEGQKSVLEFTCDSHKTNIEQLSLVKNDLQSRLVTLRRLAQTIRSDIYSTETEWSEFVVQKFVEIEAKIRGYVQLQSFIDQKLEEIRELSKIILLIIFVNIKVIQILMPCGKCGIADKGR